VSYYESRIKALEARIEEMAQLERMKAVKVEAQLMVSIGELQVENTRLKAEVETLRNLGIKLESMIDPLEAENARLKAKVERLTKAGDDMADDLPPFGSKLDWLAAKKGGQS
jgi:chromosome segregation ATPase